MKWLEGIKDKGLVLDVKNKKMSENQWLIFLFFISLSRGEFAFKISEISCHGTHFFNLENLNPLMKIILSPS